MIAEFIAGAAVILTIIAAFLYLVRRGDGAAQYKANWVLEKSLREQKEKALAERDAQYQQLYQRYAKFVSANVVGLTDDALVEVLNGPAPRPSDELLPFPDGDEPNGGTADVPAKT